MFAGCLKFFVLTTADYCKNRKDKEEKHSLVFYSNNKFFLIRKKSYSKTLKVKFLKRSLFAKTLTLTSTPSDPRSTVDEITGLDDNCIQLHLIVSAAANCQSGKSLLTWTQN